MIWPFKKKPSSGQVASHMADMVSAVANSGGALSWMDMFGNFHPNELRGKRDQLALPAVFCAINLYQNKLLGLPRVSQRIHAGTLDVRGHILPSEHPSARIWMHYVNSEWTADRLLQQIGYDLQEDGNFYAIKSFNAHNDVIDLRYISPTRIPRGNIKLAEGGEVLIARNGKRKALKGEVIYQIILDETVRFQKDPASFNVSREDMFHIRSNIPDRGYYRGMGIMENNLRSANIYEATEELGKQFYKKGYKSGTFLTTDQQLGERLRKRLESYIDGDDDNFSAVDDIFQTRILEKGLKPVQTRMGMDAIRLNESRAFSVEDVSRWWNIPPALLHSTMNGIARDYEPAMLAWFKGGMNDFLTNIANQFRAEILPRGMQTTRKFSFKTFHLLKSTPKALTEASRNMFEIGALNRLQIGELLGVALDPQDEHNTQRYTPANIITVQHSKILEEKAQKSVEQLDQQIQFDADAEVRAAASHERLMSAPAVDPNAPPQAPEGDDKAPEKDDKGKVVKDDVPNPAESKPPSEENSDKRLGVRNMLCDMVEDQVNGMNTYLNRVLDQKRESRPNDFETAVEEFMPKFHNKLDEVFRDDVLEELDLTDTFNVWQKNPDQETYTNLIEGISNARNRS